MKQFNSLKKMLGSALVEVMIGAAVLGVGLLGVLKLQSSLAAGNSAAKQRSEAVVLAQQQLEVLRNYQTFSTTTGSTAYADISSGSDTVQGTNATYTRTWTVTTSSSPVKKTINMVVSWTNANNESQRVNYSTVISGAEPAHSGSVMTQNSTQLLGPGTGANSVNGGATTGGTTTDGTTTGGTSTGGTTTGGTTTGGTTTGGTTTGGTTTGGSTTDGTTSGTPIPVTYTLSGSYSIGTGGDDPGQVYVPNISISAIDTSGTSACTTNTGTTSYTCTVSSGWSGKIKASIVASSTNSSPGTAIICHSVGSYSNVTASINPADAMQVIKSSKTCSTPTAITQTW